MAVVPPGSSDSLPKWGPGKVLSNGIGSLFFILSVGIKRLLDDLRVTPAKVRETAAKQNLVLFSNLNEKYANYNCSKIKTAERVYAGREEIKDLSEKG
ncbi:hypothetical protein Tco_0978089 [Tanacetum coccineum]|uniref:Uncharacterized protein n=1 Tax=Tanacetum coccineum TaxID=301880 RepID=A0ABQ5EM26_9ASTR